MNKSNVPWLYCRLLFSSLNELGQYAPTWADLKNIILSKNTTYITI